MNIMLTRILSLLLILTLTFSCASAEDNPETESVQDTAADSEDSTETAQPAKAYILLTFSGGSYWLPLPESEDYTVPVRQVRSDGQEELNLIHVTPDGFYMEESTCENQDCVEQGVVTLENRDTRILFNAVICLPNMVSLALYTPEEVLEMYASSAAQDGSTEDGAQNNQ